MMVTVRYYKWKRWQHFTSRDVPGQPSQEPFSLGRQLQTAAPAPRGCKSCAEAPHEAKVSRGLPHHEAKVSGGLPHHEAKVSGGLPPLSLNKPVLKLIYEPPQSQP